MFYVLLTSVTGYSDVAQQMFSADITNLPNDLVTPLTGGLPNVMTVIGTNVVSLCLVIFSYLYSFIMVGNPYATYWTERCILVHFWMHLQKQQAVFSNIL